MSRQSYFDLVDRIYQGRLAAQLTEWRQSGMSFEDIAHELRANNVSVTGETVRTWCTRAGLHSPATGPAA